MKVEEFYMDEERDETGLVRAACWRHRTCTAMPHSVRAGGALLNGGERASAETAILGHKAPDGVIHETILTVQSLELSLLNTSPLTQHPWRFWVTPSSWNIHLQPWYCYVKFRVHTACYLSRSQIPPSTQPPPS